MDIVSSRQRFHSILPKDKVSNICFHSKIGASVKDGPYFLSVKLALEFGRSGQSKERILGDFFLSLLSFRELRRDDFVSWYVLFKCKNLSN